MRNIVWLVLLFAAAVVAALALGDNDGLVSLYWSGWRVELSLNLFLLLVLALGFAVVTAVQGVNALIGLPARARQWRDLRRERAAQAALNEALAELFAGRYSRSYKAAQRALDMRGEGPGTAAENQLRQLAQLLAASSLHSLQDRGRRDQMLQRVLKPGRSVSAGPMDDGARLLATEWALDDRDATRAQALLAELPPGVARRTLALRLKLQAQRLARHPLDALGTARLLSKHQAFSAVAAQGLLRSLAFEAMDATHDIEQLRQVWQQFDPSDQRDPYVVARAARRAAALGQADQGRQWLRPVWDQMPKLEAEARAEAAHALVDAVDGVGDDWLKRVETAQTAHATDTAVQAAAGAVYASRHLWGKARRPLEMAANDAQRPSRVRRQCWRALALLAQEQGDMAMAEQCSQQAAGID